MLRVCKPPSQAHTSHLNALPPPQAGLPALLLRLSADGHGRVEVIGPPGTAALVTAASAFVKWVHPQASPRVPCLCSTASDSFCRSLSRSWSRATCPCATPTATWRWPRCGAHHSRAAGDAASAPCELPFRRRESMTSALRTRRAGSGFFRRHPLTMAMIPHQATLGTSPRR